MSINKWLNWKLLYYALHLIGFAMLFYVLRGLDYAQLFLVLKSNNLLIILIGLISLIVMYVLKTFRWLLIVKILGGKITFSKAFQFYILAVFFSVITPGRIGEFVKVYFLRKNSILNTKDAWVSTIIDRFFDLIVIGFVGVFSALYISKLNYAYGIFFILALFIMLILFLFPKISIYILFKFIKKREIKENISLIGNSILKVRMIVPASIFLTMLALALLIFIPYAVANSGQYKIDWFTAIGSVSISNILSFLPITIAGFGTRELVFTYFWAQLSYPKYAALNASTVYFVVVYIGTLALGLIVYLSKFYKNINLKDLKNERNN